MVYVRLEKDWTDQDGKAHAAGTMVDVDPATLAGLQADGIVGEETDWAGPTGGKDVQKGDWAGPTGSSN